MEQVNKQNLQTKPTNKKRTLKIILFSIISLILILIIILITSILVITSKIKDSTNDTSIDIINENLSTDTIINDLLYNAFNDAKETNEVKISFNEQSFNQLLYSIASPLSFGPCDIISAYGSLSEDKISINVPLKIANINSIIKTDLYITENNGSFTFQLKALELGRLKINNNLIKFTLKQILKKTDLYQQLINKGFSFSYDLDQITIKLSKENILDIINKIIPEPDNYLYSALADLLLGNPELLTLSFGKQGKIGATLNISNLLYKEEVDGSLPYNFPLSKISEDINQLLDMKILSNNLAYETLLFQYLNKGYDKTIANDVITAEEINFLQTIDLSSIGITNNTSYQGITKAENKSMINYFQSLDFDQIPSILNPKLDIRLNESVFNAIFKGLGVIGTGLIASKLDQDNKYQTSYFVIEQFFVKIIDNEFTINIIIKIGDARIILKATLYGETSSLSSIDTSLKSMKIGEVVVNEKTQIAFLDYLKQVLINETWLVVKPTEKEVQLAFGDYISNIPVIGLMSNPLLSSYQTSFKKDTPEGYLAIALSFWEFD